MMYLARSTVLAATFAVSIAGSAPSHAADALDCVITPSLSVDVGSPIEGILADVLVDRGDAIRKGDVIARLRAEVETANVELARVKAENDSAIESGRTRVAFYRRQRDRALQLFERKVTAAEATERAETELILAENELLTAEYQQRLAKVELTRARVILELKTIRSPMDGIVTQRMLDPGAFVYDQAGIVRLAAVDPLRVEAYAPIEMRPALERAAHGVVTPQAPFDQPHRAQIRIVDTIFDVASGTFGIRLELPNPGKIIPAGIKCRLSILAEIATGD